MSIAVKDIITEFLPTQFIGNMKQEITSVEQLNPGNHDHGILCWCNRKNTDKINDVLAGTVIIPNDTPQELLQPTCNYILVDNPRQYFRDVLVRFFWKNKHESAVSLKASISSSAAIGMSPFIGDGVVIEEDCIIGNYVKILNNTIIHRGTTIGNNTIIGANNVIGNYGFGYEENNEGNNELMPHIGKVVIGDHVEIGNNNCIDRAVLGATKIGKHTKIHSFVQVGHGVEVGENCLVTAHVTISGGTIIGNHVWLGPGVIVSNKLKIGDKASLSIGAVVLQDVPPGALIIGNPGRIIKNSKL
jgi:UDP-3-O-[3-hydroxymyristoyl] glucosamine N-acyltransferase